MATDNGKYRSRKFLFALFYTLISTAVTGYFAYKWQAKPPQVMTVLQWYLTFAGMILALYGATSIADKKLNAGRGGQ